jgi:hypothetical protein
LEQGLKEGTDELQSLRAGLRAAKDEEAELVCNPELLSTVFFPALKAALITTFTEDELPKELCNKERVSFVASFIKLISGT